jgi:hypothetical protein
MKTWFLGTAFLTAILLSSGNSYADGPFGVEMGANIASLNSCAPLEKKGVFKCTSVPKPHQDFEFWIVKHHPSTGVCFIKGVGADIKNDRYGSGLRSKADELAKQVAKTYGPPTTSNDFIRSGALWKDANEWTMALTKKERFYDKFWTSDEGFRGKNHVKSVLISADGGGSDSGWVSVMFEYDNINECNKAIENENAQAF